MYKRLETTLGVTTLAWLLVLNMADKPYVVVCKGKVFLCEHVRGITRKIKGFQLIESN